MNARTDHAALIKTEAKRLGFISCGISKAGFLAEEAPRLESWLKGQMQGSMTYMERNFDKRLDPTKLVPGAKSVVSLLYNYFPSQEQETGTYKISKYAYGEDYHYVIKDKLKDLMTTIRDQIGAVEGRVFVDSAPILEKAWAAKSGLGWVGKHSNLLSKQVGSFFFYRRAHHRFGPGRRWLSNGSLRELYRLYRCLSNGGHYRAICRGWQ